MSEADVTSASIRIAHSLSRFLPEGATIAAYAGINGEPDPAPLLAGLRQDLVLAWPVTASDRSMAMIVPDGPLQAGPFGIPEPVDGETLQPDDIHAILVPGLLFAPNGDRLGQGAGYYDRFLARMSKRAALVGIGYTWQVIDRLPIEPHDIPMTHLALDDGDVTPATRRTEDHGVPDD